MLGFRLRTELLIPLLISPLLLATESSWASDADKQVSDRPRIGLVLSGGSARGAAHVGIIKVLDELRVPVDFIAGTSMGAVVGGLYASGMEASDLESIFERQDWATRLTDRPPRAQRSFRRKSDDFGFLVNFDVGIRAGKLQLPGGLIEGQNFAMELRRYLLPVATIKDFDHLPIPFRAVATDIGNGEPVVIGSGELVTAIRASMALPGFFSPVLLNSRLLIDGSAGNNLPANVARQMGANILIVVDVGLPLMQQEQLGSALNVTRQALSILIDARANEQRAVMTADDVLITPDLGDIGSQDFHRAQQAIKLGERAARQMVASLRRFALPPRDYAEHRASQKSVRTDIPVVTRVVIENDSRLSPKALAARLSIKPGERLNVDKLEAEIADIYGLDTFSSVDYALYRLDQGNELRVHGFAKDWGPNYLRFGVNLEDDFRGTSTYNLATRLTMTELNRLGGELRTDLIVGDDPELGVEFFQPLDYRARWYVLPRMGISGRGRGLFQDGSQLARLRSRESEVSLGVGRQFGRAASLQLTLTRSRTSSRVLIGDPAIGKTYSHETSLSLRFEYDTIDRLAIPRRGTVFGIAWSALRRRYGASQNADLAQMIYLKPQTWGRNTIVHWWDIGSVVREGSRPINAFELGGLYNLTGYARGELIGQHFAIGRLLYLRRVGQQALPIINTSLFLGASLEAGNVWVSREDVSANDLIYAGSLTAMIDTAIGPLYLAYGTANGGRRSVYLYLGQTF